MAKVTVALKMWRERKSGKRPGRDVTSSLAKKTSSKTTTRTKKANMFLYGKSVCTLYTNYIFYSESISNTNLSEMT